MKNCIYFLFCATFVTSLPLFSQEDESPAIVLDRVPSSTLKILGGIPNTLAPSALKRNFNSMFHLKGNYTYTLPMGIQFGGTFTYLVSQVNNRKIQNISSLTADPLYKIDPDNTIRTSQRIIGIGAKIGYEHLISGSASMHYNVTPGYSFIRYKNPIKAGANPRLYNFNSPQIDAEIGINYYFDEKTAVGFDVVYSYFGTNKINLDELGLGTNVLAYTPSELKDKKLQYLTLGISFIYLLKN